MIGTLLILPNIKERKIYIETESIKNEPQISIYLKGDSGDTTSDTIPDGYGIIPNESYCYTTDKNNKTYNLVDYDPSSKTLKLNNTVTNNTK